MDPIDEVEGQEEAPPVEQFNQDLPPPGDNLVPDVEKAQGGQEWLDKLVKDTIRNVKADRESMKDWLEMRDDQLKLYAGVVAKMGYPAEGQKAPHDPIVARTVLQMWTRGCEQITPVKGDLIQVSPVGHEDEETAFRKQQHLNWQLRHKVPSWVEGHREAYLQYLMSGSTFRERSFDPMLKVTRFDTLTAENVVISYAEKDISPLMTRVPRVTRVLNLYRWELEQHEDEGAFVNVAKLFEKGGGGSTEQETSVIRKTGDVVDGMQPSTSVTMGDDAESKPRELFRVHMWTTLPGQKRMRPITLVVDVAKSVALSLTMREDDDPFDRVRFDGEMKVWQSQTQNLTAKYEADMAKWQAFAEQMAARGAPSPPQPTQPQMPPEPEPVRQVPIHNMLHYRLFPNPNGFMGIGVAYLLTNANELINELEKAYVLSSQFANLQQGFLPKGALGKRGSVKLEMGKFIETELEAGDMAGIKSFEFHPPSESLWKFIQKHKEDAYSLVADVDTLTGEAGPTNETKAAAMQRMGNATALMTAIAGRYLETMAYEPRMLARDNALFGPPSEKFWVTSPNKEDPNGKPQYVQQESKRDDYYNEFDFTFTADSRLNTQTERVNTAMAIIDRIIQTPQLAQDPVRGPMLIYVAFKNFFRAIDMPEFEQALGEPPPKPEPEPEPTPMDQVDENQMFFNGQDHPVLPDDDDEDHLLKMDGLETSPYYAEMPATGKQLFDRHKAAHTAQSYKKQADLMAMMQGDQNGMDLSQAGGPGGMAGGPGQPIPDADGAGPGGGGAAFPLGQEPAVV